MFVGILVDLSHFMCQMVFVRVASFLCSCSVYTWMVEFGVGCCWGHHFVGTFCYADDVVLLAHCASALRCMLDICSCYASSHGLASRTLPTQRTYLVVFSITVASVMLLFWRQIVYKRIAQSLLHTSLFMNLAIINATKLLTIQWQKYVYIASSTLNAIAVTTLMGYMLLEITKIITSKFCPRINRRDEAVEYEHIMMDAVNHNDML